MTKSITLKQGEAKTVTLTVKDKETGEAVDLTGAELFLGVKQQKSDAQPTFSKSDADFDKSQANQGIIRVFLNAADTAQTPGPYVGELKVSWPVIPEAIEKSSDLTLIIEEAVTS